MTQSRSSEPASQQSGAAEHTPLFSTVFMTATEGEAQAGWRERVTQLEAVAYPADEGAALFALRWGGDRYLAALGSSDWARMSAYVDFVKVAAGSEVISQDELGDYLIVLLEGRMAVDRLQPGGERARLALAQPGDMLGEMSLFDAGARFSACTAIDPCVIGAITADALDRMTQQDPRLAVALLASLSRRLSLRLRQVSARLSALLARG